MKFGWNERCSRFLSFQFSMYNVGAFWSVTLTNDDDDAAVQLEKLD